jgi:hypothetical protein
MQVMIRNDGDISIPMFTSSLDGNFDPWAIEDPLIAD